MALAIAAKGIYFLIKNSGTMKLIISPKLSKDDYEVIKRAIKTPEDFISDRMLRELENFRDECAKEHVYALGWMIANKKLEIKVALVRCGEDEGYPGDNSDDGGIFHQKVGILEDAIGNVITFSGSVNESVRGWTENIEEFKVFRGWINEEKDYVESDIDKFETFWMNRSTKANVFSLPRAVEKKMLEISPKDISELKLERWYTKAKTRVRLYKYQNEAVLSWIKNGLRGIFEMATGSGKTFTALGCLDEVFKKNGKTIAIIACPFNHLIQQWMREIQNYGLELDDNIVADSTNPNWKKQVVNVLVDISLGYRKKAILLTTHNTLSSVEFLRLIREYKSDSKIMLIADEVHGLGAEKRKAGLAKEYEYRLGLSATPQRWFDEVGTDFIYDYFGGVVYEFGLERAINEIREDTGESFLAPYKYFPYFAYLSSDEISDYVSITRTITAKMKASSEPSEADNLLQILLFKRANIIKNAAMKYSVLENILESIKQDLFWTIVYCAPKQMNKVMDILKGRKVIAHRFTMAEGVVAEERYGRMSERDYLLRSFAVTRPRSMYQPLSEFSSHICLRGRRPIA